MFDLVDIVYPHDHGGFYEVIEHLPPSKVVKYLKSLGWIKEESDIDKLPIKQRRMIIDDADKFKKAVESIVEVAE